jgi:hypothetical protein
MHRDRAFRISAAVDRGEIEAIEGAVDAYRSILRPSSLPNLAGRIGALKATKRRLEKKLLEAKSEPDQILIRERIVHIDRRISAYQRELGAVRQPA